MNISTAVAQALAAKAGRKTEIDEHGNLRTVETDPAAENALREALQQAGRDKPTTPPVVMTYQRRHTMSSFAESAAEDAVTLLLRELWTRAKDRGLTDTQALVEDVAWAMYRGTFTDNRETSYVT